MKTRCFFVVLFLSTFGGFSQSFTGKKISESESISLIQFLRKSEETDSIRFFFKEEWLTNFIVAPEHNGKTIPQLFDQLFLNTNIKYTFLFNYACIIWQDPHDLLRYQEVVNRAYQEKRDIEKLVIGKKQPRSVNALVTLQLKVEEDLRVLPLEGAQVVVDGKDNHLTDSAGTAVIRLKPGSHVLQINRSNFSEKVIDLQIYDDGEAKVILREAPTFLKEVEVSDQPITVRNPGHTSIKMVEVQRSANFLGEVDIVKRVQMQPGVTTVGEVATGFNVRGGGVDQNLVLFDGVPIFNTSHALGFFTSFNAASVESVNLYKGAIPAEFGGRASSVLDIKSKEGDLHQWRGSGGVGIISSNLTLEGPVVKSKSSVMSSLRWSYSDWMLNLVQSRYAAVSQSAMSFYDGALKFVHKFTPESKVSISGYLSNDRFKLTNDTLYHLSNAAFAVKFDYAFPSSTLFMSSVLSTGSYKYNISEPDSATAADVGYRINYPALKFDFTSGELHKLSFGFHNTFYIFQPGYLKPRDTSNQDSIVLPEEQAIESAVYLSDAFDIGERFSIDAGARISIFNRLGPGVEYIYAEGRSREVRNVVDSIVYNDGSIIATYFGFEPRLSFTVDFSDEASLKASYNRTNQYLHLISNTAAVAPADVWQASNGHLRPQVADQLSLGYYKHKHGSL